MYIATALLEAIKERKIDEFFSMEENIVKLVCLIFIYI